MNITVAVNIYNYINCIYDHVSFYYIQSQKHKFQIGMNYCY